MGQAKQPEWKRRKVRHANRMRNNPTSAEARLKVLLDERLKGTRDWPKFIFQRRALGYILDFFDTKHGLCIEVDGGVHTDPNQQKWDERRTAALARYGVKVLRIRNERIFNEAETVMREIEAAWRCGAEVSLPKYRQRAAR